MSLELNQPGFLYSARKNLLEYVQWQIDNNPDTDVNQRPEPPYSYTALHWATYNGNTKMVELLLGHGADTEVQCNFGMTPLHIAACWNFPDIASLLIQHGADVNCKFTDPRHVKDVFDTEVKDDELGIRPLHLVDSAHLIGALYYCRRTLPKSDFKRPYLMVEFFKKHFYKRPYTQGRFRRDIDRSDFDSESTPIRPSGPELTKHLLKAGARTGVLDQYYQSPLDWVKASDNQEIQNLLNEAANFS